MFPSANFLLRSTVIGNVARTTDKVRVLTKQLPKTSISFLNISRNSVTSSTAATPRESYITNANVQDEGKKLLVKWDNGKSSTFHSMWLRFCCPCPQCRDTASNMTSYKIEDIPLDMTLEASLLGNGNIGIKWCQEEHVAEFDPKYLAEHSYSKEDLSEKQADARPAPNRKKEVETIEFSEIQNSEEVLYKWLKIINEDGLCILKNVPTEYNYIKKVITMIGPILATLYGETFDVKLKAEAINLSYSTAALSFHTDLAHYETPPGLQFLHCIEFDQSLEGGETTFIDLFAVAEEFKQQYPEHFQTLCKVPATFQRIHAERDDPVHMIVRKPHFYVNERNEVIGINWHSHHQGPLSVASEYVEPYFQAYQLFARAIVNSPYVKAVRFQPGDLVACNNRRIAHGRNAYTGQGARFLQGGYVSIDEFKSKLMLLATKYGDLKSTKRVFNNDWL